MADDRLSGIVEFLRAAEALKHTLRSAHLSNGRQESTAEHSWRLSLMVMLLGQDYPNIDQLKALKLCIVHDLAEAVTGDIPAIDQKESGKGVDEAAALATLTANLPDDIAAEIMALWREYEGAETAEAKLVKGADKLETLLQHNQGANPHDFNYEFNLEYGKKHTDADPLLAQFRAILDQQTRARIEEQRQKS